MPADEAPCVNVPFPLFQSRSTPVAVVTTRSRVAVAVQVGGDAARALHPDARVRRLRDVREVPVLVLEELALRQAAVVFPVRQVAVGVRVDRVEVEPAVVVVVDPADAAAHHRLRVVGQRVVERVLGEVQADLRRDVRRASPPRRTRASPSGARSAQVRVEGLAGLHDDEARSVERHRQRAREWLAAGACRSASPRRSAAPGRAPARSLQAAPADAIARELRRARAALARPRRQPGSPSCGRASARPASRRSRRARPSSQARPRCWPASAPGCPPRRQGPRTTRHRARVATASVRRSRRARHRPALAGEDDQRPRGADDRQRPEQRHLRLELRRHRRDQERREQTDRDGVDLPAAGRLGRRLRVGDHEVHEDEDLGRGHEHAPEVRVRRPARGASSR